MGWKPFGGEWGARVFWGDGGPFWMKWYLNLDAVSFCGLALRRVFIFNNDYALMSKQPLIEGTPLEREDSFFRKGISAWMNSNGFFFCLAARSVGRSVRLREEKWKNANAKCS